MGRLTSLLLVLGLAACGRATEQTDVKMAAVGSDPDDIGPAPDYYGGIVELNWLDIAGGQIPFGILGFLYYQPAGPEMAGFDPPYAAVSGLGFIMEEDMAAPDALLGTFARPPETVGACQTVYEPFSFVNNLADVGDALSFTSEDGLTVSKIGRYPGDFPTDPRNVFTYYFGAESWRQTPTYTYSASDGSDPRSMQKDVLIPANFAFGEPMTLGFPGGIPPADATVASIPVPLAAAGADRTVVMPTNPQGVEISWVGPRYDEDGAILFEDGEQATCLRYQYKDGDVPADPEDCVSLPIFRNSAGQVYTAPWETEGGVRFRWIPSGADETVSISVRFLGAVDLESQYFLTSQIEASDGSAAAVQACDEEDAVTWVLDPTLVDETQPNGLIPALQGDPGSNLAEVTCRASDEPGEDGFAEFTLTEDMVAEALAYGRSHNAGGVVFYFARSTRTEVTTPTVRDTYGNRRQISPVLVVGRALQLGRFWYTP